MLTSANTIRALASSPHLLERKATAVLDPVMISTSGHTLLPDDAIDALKGLFKLVDWLTPNIPEAQRLSGGQASQGAEIGGVDDLIKLARSTAETCDVPIVLLKGGHSPLDRQQVKDMVRKGGYRVIYEQGDDEEDTIECLDLWRKSVLPDQEDKAGKVVVDILVQQGSSVPTLFVGKYVESTSTHGTGCTLSSAIAASYGSLPEDDRNSECPRDTPEVANNQAKKPMSRSHDVRSNTLDQLSLPLSRWD